MNPKSAAGFERRAALYGRGITQRMDRFNPAGDADQSTTAALAIQADLAERMAERGVK